MPRTYGYRRITALLKRDGWQVGKDRVERIWRREELKISCTASTQKYAMAKARYSTGQVSRIA
jgi:hypothetical protein